MLKQWAAKLSYRAQPKERQVFWYGAPKHIPSSVTIADQDDLTIRVYNKQGTTAAEYQPSVRGTLTARAYGLRSDLRIPTSLENITHFRAYRSTYNTAGTLMNRFDSLRMTVK